MTNALYDPARESFLRGEISWNSNNIKVVLVSASYTFSAAHQYLSSVPGGARVATSANLVSKTTTGGVADAADISFPSVTGAPVVAAVIYQDTGTEGTSRLIAYIDTATGLPVTPNGGPINITWNSGNDRIFRL